MKNYFDPRQSPDKKITMRAGSNGRRQFNGFVTAAAGVMALVLSASVLRAQSISMSYVTVGNPGNAPDPATGSLYGAVDYNYNIGEYDVTDAQYCTFLNAVDPTGANTLGLYSPQGDAEYGITYNAAGFNGSKFSVILGYANMPVVDVDFWSTLRFVNWMNNGEGNATTESGAYTLLGDSPTPSNSASLLANPQHSAGATVWLPDDNEWYKAAYYDPANSSYSKYATQGDSTPGNVPGDLPNQANYNNDGFSATQNGSFNSNQNYLTAVGSFTDSSSYYGTYDQSGDVWNWNSAGVNDTYAVVRGGDWFEYITELSSSERFYNLPTLESSWGGFRVASVAAVPEPSTWAMIAAGVGGLFAFRRRRRS